MGHNKNTSVTYSDLYTSVCPTCGFTFEDGRKSTIKLKRRLHLKKCKGEQENINLDKIIDEKHKTILNKNTSVEYKSFNF